MLFVSPDLDFMDLLGEDRQWTVGRKLMQVNDTLTSEDAGFRSSKNCTEPGNSYSCCCAQWLPFSLVMTKEELDAIFSL